MEELYQSHEYEMYIRDQMDEFFEYDYYEEPVILYDNQLEQIILNPNNPHYNELLSKKENDLLFQEIYLAENGWPTRTSATRKAIYQAWYYAQQQILLPAGG